MARRRNATIKKGDVVAWGDKTCRVLKARRISGLAVFQTGGDRELFLDTLDGEEVGWVGENEVEKLEEADGP